jgi:hypothetical protein
MEYRVVQGDSLKELTDLVQGCISEGWSPQGGVSAVAWNVVLDRKGYTDTYWGFLQAMVRVAG